MIMIIFTLQAGSAATGGDGAIGPAPVDVDRDRDVVLLKTKSSTTVPPSNPVSASPV
jgi:hypothetical protein